MPTKLIKGKIAAVDHYIPDTPDIKLKVAWVYVDGEIFNCGIDVNLLPKEFKVGDYITIVVVTYKED